MKKLSLFALALFVAMAFAGCDSNDDGGAPNAVNDTATTGEDETVVIDVLANDTDPDGDDLTITAVSNPSDGTAEIADNKVEYTPDAGFNGTDTFTYTVSDGDNTATGTVTVQVIQRIVGDWVSEGANVAPGLAQNPAFPTERIDATFRSDGTYSVVARNTSGVEVTFEGTFETAASANGNIRTIVLNQSVPTTLTSRGIYEVNVAANTMQYEVIQTEPEIQGFTAPTAAEGFGSTKYNGTPLGPIWIQNYVRAGS